MKTEGRIVASRRLPRRLVGNLFEIVSEQGLEDLELASIDPIARQHGADVGGPVNEPEMTSTRGMRPDHVHEIAVAIRRVVAESLRLQPVHFAGDRGDVGGGVHIANHCVSVFTQMRLIVHIDL
jgi:hypothetical protein